MNKTDIKIPMFEDFGDNQDQRLLHTSLLNITDMAIDSINQGANVNAKDKNLGRAALHYAAMNGNLELIEYIIKHKGDIDITDNNGDTPLMVASWHGKYDAIKYLLKNSKNRNKENNDGETALFSAISGSKFDNQIEKLFIDSGAFDINHRNNDGNTVIFKILINDNSKLLDKLIKKGADPYNKNNSGKTLQDYAIKMGKHNIISYYDSLNNK